jgi:hypothetical protein
MKMDMKGLQKGVSGSLSCMDNIYVKVIIYVVLILYSSTIFENINMYVGSLYKYSFVKIIVLLLIVALSMKCPAMGILLAISYVISIIYEKHGERPLELLRREGFRSDDDDDDERRNDERRDDDNDDEKGRDDDRGRDNDRGRDDDNRIERFIPTASGDEFSMNSNNNSGYCPPNLVSDSLSDPCTPVATFKGELNAQGLNQISGFDDFVTGAPL